MSQWNSLLNSLRPDIKRRAQILVLGAVCALGVSRADDAAASSATPVDLSKTQESLRGQSDQVNDSLLDIVDDMRLNGMSDTQTSALQQTSGQLDSLNQQDMKQIVELLKTAAAAPNPTDAQTALLNAYQQQKDVSTSLKTLALALSTQMTAEVTVKQVEALVLRQDANERETELVRDPKQPLMTKHGDKRAVLGRVRTEQKAIREDAALLAETLTRANPSPAESADIDAMKNLATQAEHQTRSAALPAAQISQEQLKAKLLQILATWKAKEDEGTRLQHAQAQVEALRKEQAALADAAKQMPFRLDPMADSQATIADRAELAQDVGTLNSAAGSELQKALDNMRESTDELASGKRASDSVPAQNSAVARLASAAKILADEAQARDAKKNQSLTDLNKDLQHLKDNIDATKPTAENAMSPSMQANLAQLQKDASQIAPQAEKNLASAAQELQHAKPDSAAQQLAAASQSIKKQMDAIAKPAHDLADLQKAANTLKEAIEKSNDANEQLKGQAPPDAAHVSGDLATAHADVGKLDAQFGQLSDMAHEVLQQAGTQLQQGGDAWSQGDRPGAQMHTDAGLQILKQAADQLAQGMKSAQARGMMAAGLGNGASKPGNQSRSDPHVMHAALHEEKKGKPGDLLKGGLDLQPGGAQVVGTLAPKDRDALNQFESEKTPPEYAPMVQQYMKNLSDSSSH